MRQEQETRLVIHVGDDDTSVYLCGDEKLRRSVVRFSGSAVDCQHLDLVPVVFINAFLLPVFAATE